MRTLREIDLASPAYARGEIGIYADRIYKPGVPMDGDFAQWVLAVAADERVTWRFRSDCRDALTNWLRTHPAPIGSDTWPARYVTLGSADGLTPVGVSIWDVGVDRSVYRAGCGNRSRPVTPTRMWISFRDMPGSINLPNVISVGTVDQAGLLTNFASTGKSIDLSRSATTSPASSPAAAR